MLKFFNFIMVLVLADLEEVKKEGYGAYEFSWVKFEPCPGPKPACGKVEILNTQNMSDVIFKMNITKECPVTQARVVIGSKNSTSTKKLWNYTLNTPCQHFVLGPVLTKAFNISKRACKVNKGLYEIHQNVLDSSAAFLGPNFFYGTYTFKVFAYNKRNTLFCVDDEVKVVKSYNLNRKV